MGALFAILLPLLPSLIQGIQAAFSHVKPPTPAPVPAPIPVPVPAPAPDLGAAKADVVLQQLRALIEKLVAINSPLPDGTLPSTIPVTDDALRGLIEGIFQDLKAKDQLTPATAAAPAGQWMLINANSATPIQVGGKP